METEPPEAVMNERVMQCLVYAPNGTSTAERIASLLAQQGICATCSATEEQCLDCLAKRIWPLLLVDANGGTPGLLRLLARCREAHPDVSVLILVKPGDIAMAVRAMKAGAADCLETPVEPARLLSAVTALRRQADHHGCDPRLGLTSMERTVLRHILDGRTNRQIAEILSRSPRTIEVHRRHIMRKSGAAGLVDLVKHALHAGLLDHGIPAHCRANAAPRAESTS